MIGRLDFPSHLFLLLFVCLFVCSYYFLWQYLFRLEENEKLVLTPFEKNIDIWRQLWRVVERSDLVRFWCL